LGILLRQYSGELNNRKADEDCLVKADRLSDEEKYYDMKIERFLHRLPDINTEELSGN